MPLTKTPARWQTGATGASYSLAVPEIASSPSGCGPDARIPVLGGATKVGAGALLAAGFSLRQLRQDLPA